MTAATTVTTAMMTVTTTAIAMTITATTITATTAATMTGTYTIPANIGRAVVTITGASVPTKDETPGQFEGKISFWEKLVNFFKMIADFFKGLFK